MIHSHDITCHRRSLKFRPSTIKQIPYRWYLLFFSEARQQFYELSHKNHNRTWGQTWHEMKCLQFILSTYFVFLKEQMMWRRGWMGQGSVQLCNVQNVSPDVTKEGTRVPFGKHKMPSRICVGLSYLISAAPSSFSIIRKWLLIRRRSILCQRVYKWPQHTVAASPPVMGLMSGRHAYILCNSLSWSDSALSYAT